MPTPSLEEILTAEREHPKLTARGAGLTHGQVLARLERIERAVAADPTGCLVPDADGFARLCTPEGEYRAGRFSTPTVGELRTRLSSQGSGQVRLSGLVGTGPLADVGALQALFGPDVVFQAASQFNCLEAMSARLAPVASYPGDNTQGPRASVSAFPGTFLRHYQAPGPGGPYQQSDQHQLNLLADVFEDHQAKVHHGYLRFRDIRDVPALAGALEDRGDLIRVGLHEGVEVALGSGWGGPVSRPDPRIHQVFTSTIALGGYSSGAPRTAELERIQNALLLGAYRGTLLGAAAIGAHSAILTLIGGGVFGNDHFKIWSSIRAACDEVQDLGASLDVWVNLRAIRTTKLRDQIVQDITAREGILLHVDTGRRLTE